MSHKDIVKKYAARCKNSRTGIVEWHGFHIFCMEDIIYSYGRHFPMAKYLGEQKNKSFFIKNSDKYSSSTSAHQSMVSQYCQGPSIPRNTLNNAFANAQALKFETDFEIGGKKYQYSNSIEPDVKDIFHLIEKESIYLWRKPFSEWLWFDTETGIYYSNCVHSGQMEDSTETVHYTDEQKIPRYAKFGTRYRNDKNRFQQGWANAKEIVVLKFDLPLFDSETYFVCNNRNVWTLPRKPKNISDALRMRSAKNHTGPDIIDYATATKTGY